MSFGFSLPMFEIHIYIERATGTTFEMRFGNDAPCRLPRCAEQATSVESLLTFGLVVSLELLRKVCAPACVSRCRDSIGMDRYIMIPTSASTNNNEDVFLQSGEGVTTRLEAAAGLTKEVILEGLETPRVPGAIWNIVSKKWLDKCLIFIELIDTSNCLSTVLLDKDPGPMDNSSLDNGKLQSDLLEDSDNILVPQFLWSLLRSSFGAVSGHHPIEVKIAAKCDDPADGPPTLTCNPSNSDVSFDAEDTGFLNMSDQDDDLLHSELVEALDLRVPGEDLTKAENQTEVQTMKQDKAASAIPVTKPNRLHASSGKAANNKLTVLLGVCGLRNVGNSCYLNSVVQSLGNCVPLQKYFIERRYIDELNVSNQDGAHGNMAIAFGFVIGEIWSGEKRTASAMVLSNHIHRFSHLEPFRQHDAQEAFSVLINKISEDINQVFNKPKTAVLDAGDRSQEELADEARRNLESRHKSFIVDHFFGFLMSKVSCPVCTCSSPTFEPFCSLSLPFPDRERTMEITLHLFDATEPPKTIRLTVPRKGDITDLVTCLSALCEVAPDQMMVAEIVNCHLHQIFDGYDLLDEIHDGDNIAVFEIPKAAADDMPSFLFMPVVLWDNGCSLKGAASLFGHPIIAVIPRDTGTCHDLYTQIHQRLQAQMIVRDDWDAKLISPTPFPGVPNGHDYEANPLTKKPFELFLTDPNNVTSAVRLENNDELVKLQNLIDQRICAAKFTTAYKTRHFKKHGLASSGKIDLTSLYRPPPLQLTECIEEYLSEERLSPTNAWLCPKCKRHEEASKKIDLWELPKIMVLHMKRFACNALNIATKINTEVLAPLRSLDMSPFVAGPHPKTLKYDLVSVINHYGVLQGGHYTANALNKFANVWFSFDDTVVTPIANQDVITSSAYMFFYIREDVSSD